jgi:hypothetical protein
MLTENVPHVLATYQRNLIVIENEVSYRVQVDSLDKFQEIEVEHELGWVSGPPVYYEEYVCFSKDSVPYCMQLSSGILQLANFTIPCSKSLK